jgi:hypothetical protein
MSSNNILLEKIELYTRGKLSSEEKELFEQELNADESLRRKVELSMMVDEMVVAKEALQLKEQMRKDLYKPKSDWKKYAGIALIIVFSAAGSWFYSNSQENRNPPVPASPTPQIQFPADNKVSDELAEITETNDPDKKHPVIPETSTKEIQEPSGPESFVKPAEKNDIEPEKGAIQKDLPVKQQPDPGLPQETPQASPCSSLQNVVESAVTPSCKGEQNGEIHFDAASVKGGTPPYTFISGDRETKSSFDQVPAGHYSITIRDAKNCMVQSSRKIYVPEKICKSPKQYVFNPEYDHSWTIPYDKDRKPTRIVILDKSGRIFYESLVSDFSPEGWAAQSNTGLMAEVGLYFFTIEYADGYIEEGSVTVTR